jgi:LCP family protein required for cell wall assembly
MSLTTPPTGRASVPGVTGYPDGSARYPGAPEEPPGARVATAWPGGPGPAGGVSRGGRRTGPRWGRIALVIGIVLVLVIGGVALTGYLFISHFNAKLNRIDAFAGIPADRPAAVVHGAQNILLLGSDSRDPSAQADLKGWRTDTIIVMHVTADHQHAYLISIPRDSWVHIPRSPSQPTFGDTDAKINAAFSWGGVPLTVETVEQFTGVRIDHVALINFGGFERVTDALGGVDMKVDKTITSIHPPHRVFTRGEHHFNGAEALDYVRQRKQYGDGDISRVRHQQQFLKAIMDKATSTGTLTDIGKLDGFLTAVAAATVVDKDFDLVSTAYDLRDLRSSDMTFLTSPWSGFVTEPDGESAVGVDRVKAASLYHAVAHDQVGPWLAANPVS